MNSETEQIFLLPASTSQAPSTSHKILLELPETTQVNLENVEDFSNVCRTCATITEFVIPIFDGEGLQNNLADKIHKHLPIQVSERDVLPRVVCYQCASTLLAWHELVQCSEQAELALRARLARACSQPPASSDCKSIAVNHDSSTEEDANTKAQAGATAGAAPRSPQPRRSCEFCGAEHPASGYEEHLVTNHADMLFHCEDCGKYVGRKDFILHMSLHAVQYSGRRGEPRNGRRGRKRKMERAADPPGPDGGAGAPPPAAPARDEEEAPGTGADGPTRGGAPGEPADDGRENEFSDHETDGFGPLPQSVFEAIEDSRDGGPADDRPAAGPTGTAKRVRACPVCGKTYTASSSYFYHVKHAHGRARAHTCSCGRAFGTRAALAAHSALHSGEARWACARCDKRFRSRAGLYVHAQTHGGAKRWACASCGRAFRWRAQLARHALRHGAERACVCATCGRGFKVRADLARHARTHAPARIACAHCGRLFAQRRYLTAHLAKLHPTAPRAAPDASPGTSEPRALV